MEVEEEEVGEVVIVVEGELEEEAGEGDGEGGMTASGILTCHGLASISG